MTYNEIYKQALEITKDSTQDSRLFDISCLLEHVFGFDRYHLPAVGTQSVDKPKEFAFFSLCRRYAAGEPLQYLIGEWEFYGLSFYVGEGVLIPRADTETLVETTLDCLRDIEKPVIADLCAGSGCISVAIAKQRPDAEVFALELSAQAFPYLAKNITRHQTGVRAIQCDVLHPPELPMLDLLVSNPPYIRAGDLSELQEQVRHEPEMALNGGTDGLYFYRSIPPLYQDLLKTDGILAFEVGYDQAQEVSALLQSFGYRDIQTRNDLAGICRVVYARRPDGVFPAF